MDDASGEEESRPAIAKPRQVKECEGHSFTRAHASPVRRIHERTVKKHKRPKLVRHYLMGRVLGRGSYGTVREAIDQQTHTRVAMKIVKEAQARKIPGGLKAVHQEAIVNDFLQHENVVQMYNHFEDDVKGKIYMVLEYVSGGSVAKLIREHPSGLPERFSRLLFKQLLHGLQYIHQAHVVHGDIKPGNLLICAETGAVKITDFGVSYVLDGHKIRNLESPQHTHSNANGNGLRTQHAAQGSVAFQPPELACGEQTVAECGFATDNWAAGVVLFHLTTGRYPFEGGNVVDMLDNIVNCTYDLPKDILSPELATLLTAMLSRNVSDRPSLEEILEHPWLAHVDIPSNHVNVVTRRESIDGVPIQLRGSDESMLPLLTEGEEGKGKSPGCSPARDSRKPQTVSLLEMSTDSLLGSLRIQPTSSAFKRNSQGTFLVDGQSFDGCEEGEEDLLEDEIILPETQTPTAGPPSLCRCIVQ